MIYLKKWYFSEILTKLKFTENFYKGIEKRLLPKNKYLYLDVLPGQGCSGFSYQFISSNS